MARHPEESALRAQLVREGLVPERWSNGPHAVYGVHDHPYGKVLVVASGSITFTIDGDKRVVHMIPPPVLPTTKGGGWRRQNSDDWASGQHFIVETATPSAEGRRSQVVGMKPGDRLELPPRTPHSALVGPEGVVCLEAHVTQQDTSA